MIYDPDAEVDRPVHTGDAETTVRNKIRYFLELAGPTVLPDGSHWWSLADIQERMRGSSTRSRLQDIMRDNITGYYEVRFHRSDVGKALYKIYRKKPPDPGPQAQLF